MSIQLKTLEKLKESQTLVDLYRDHLSNESLTGVVTDYSSSFVYLSLFSDAGLSLEPRHHIHWRSRNN